MKSRQTFLYRSDPSHCCIVCHITGMSIITVFIISHIIYCIAALTSLHCHHCIANLSQCCIFIRSSITAYHCMNYCLSIASLSITALSSSSLHCLPHHCIVCHITVYHCIVCHITALSVTSLSITALSVTSLHSLSHHCIVCHITALSVTSLSITA